MAKPLKNMIKLPHNSGTPIHQIRPKIKDFLMRSDPLGLITGLMVIFSGNLSLFKRGWPLSARLGIAVNKNQNPIPWYAYNATDYLTQFCADNPDIHVFEYGLGQSTLWWAKRVKSVTTVEHDLRWIKAPAYTNLPDNIILHHLHYNSGYEEAPLLGDKKEDKKYDIIVVDGMNRPACIPHAIAALKKGGMLIWDDSHYERYQPHLQNLINDGWLAEVFDDHGPVMIDKTQLTILRRP